MGERWELLIALAFVLLVPLLAVSTVSAHKLPVVEYAYIGHIWEESYTTIPRQAVIDEPVVFRATVEHPGQGEVIEGNVSALISIYADETEYSWFGGKPYKDPNWLLLKEEWMTSADFHERGFESSVVIERPGSYHAFIDWYHDGQYMGQSMHTLDVEQRTLGPAFLAFSAVAVIGVLVGIRMGVL